LYKGKAAIGWPPEGAGAGGGTRFLLKKPQAPVPTSGKRGKKGPLQKKKKKEGCTQEKQYERLD